MKRVSGWLRPYRGRISCNGGALVGRDAGTAAAASGPQGCFGSGGPPLSEREGSQSLNLTTGGITLLGVLVSVGLTVAFGLTGAWWTRALAGAGTTVFLVLVVKLGTRSGRGPVARLANWVIGSSRRTQD